MKKIICVLFNRMLTFSAFVLFSMHCNGDNNRIHLGSFDRAEYNLKGSVYAVILKECQYKKEFGEIIRTGSKDRKIYFMSDGKVYKEELAPRVWKKYVYDNHGLLTSEMVIHEEAGKRYDINGVSFVDNDTTEYFIYDNTYAPSGKIQEILKKQVINNGLLQTERFVFSNATGGMKYTCYDKKGIIRTFSRNNNIDKMRVNNSNRYYEWIIFTIVSNNKGQNIKRTTTYERLNGSTFSGNSESYELDVHGNVKKIIYTSPQQKRDPSGDITVKYQYDNLGNWTSRKQYRGGKLISWEERNIYYATEERDYNNIVEEDARKEERRIARRNDIRHQIESAAQAEKVLEESEMSEEKIFDIVEEMPVFGGGPNNMINWINSNIRYPKEAKDNGEQGTVFATFVIEEDGTTSNVKITKSVSRALDKEAIRLIKSMNGWIPAKSNGKTVRCRYSVRIPFRLQ